MAVAGGGGQPTTSGWRVEKGEVERGFGRQTADAEKGREKEKEREGEGEGGNGEMGGWVGGGRLRNRRNDGLRESETAGVRRHSTMCACANTRAECGVRAL